LTSRKCKDWSRIGFQGEDPTTDFRAMGILGLLNLLAFSKHPSVQNVLNDSNSQFWYPFAVCGINISSKIFNLLKNHQLNVYFYDSKDFLDDFNQIYSKFHLTFHTK
jgi:ELMO domain-containing protein